MRKVNTSIPSIAVLILFILGFMQSGFAQKPAKTNIFPATGSAGIGTITPKPSALLEMSSTTQGFLPPRMINQNMVDIVGPDRGLLVFVMDGDAPGYYFFDGTWKPLTQQGIGADQALSNLLAPTSVNVSLIPGINNSVDLGSFEKKWDNAYFRAVNGYSNNFSTIYGFNGGNNLFASIAVYGESGGNGIGVYGRSQGFYGVSGSSQTSHGVYGQTGNPLVAYAGYFNGSVYTSDTYQASDKKLKQNIQDLLNAMNIINKLHPTQYEFRQDGNYKLMNMPKGNHYGLIAQEVEEVLPDLIKETMFDPNIAKQIKTGDEQNTKNTTLKNEEEISFKAMNYTELIPIMIKGMQELSKINEEKDAAIKDLQKQIDELKQLVKSNSTPTNGKIQNRSEIVELKSTSIIEQNTPNPFTNNTSIRYSLTDNKGNAFINFYSSAGVVLKSVKLNASGKGVIDVKASELASGIYQYSLVIDGKVIETKQMIRLK